MLWRVCGISQDLLLLVRWVSESASPSKLINTPALAGVFFANKVWSGIGPLALVVLWFPPVISVEINTFIVVAKAGEVYAEAAPIC